MEPFQFDLLPTELKIQILRDSDIKSLIYLSKTSSHYRRLCSNDYDYLWKILTNELINPLHNYVDIHQFNNINRTLFHTWFQIYVYFYTLQINVVSLDYETEDGHLEMIHYLINSLANSPISIPLDKSKYLFKAARRGYLEVFKYLASRLNIDIHQDKDTALIYASMNGHLDVVEYLVEHGANVNTIGYFARHYIPLVVASQHGHLHIVQYLLDHGANINEGQPLTGAITSRSLDIATLLIDRGVTIRPFDLNMASSRDFTIFKYLVEHATFSKDNINYALVLASGAGLGKDNVDIVKYLVEQMGADVHYHKDDAFIEASKHDNDKILEYLHSVS